MRNIEILNYIKNTLHRLDTLTEVMTNNTSINEVIFQVEKYGELVDLDRKWIESMYEKVGLESLPRRVAFNIKDVCYSTFAGRLALLLHSKTCPNSSGEYLELFGPLFNPKIVKFWRENSEAIDSMLSEYDKYNYVGSWSSATVFITTYSLKTGPNEPRREMPLQMYMRVSVQLCYDLGIEAVRQAFDLYARGVITPPSPMLFNACLKKFCSGSCFLSTIGDTTKSITKKFQESCFTAKANGGQGIDVSDIRHSDIGDTGESKGVIPLMRIFNAGCNEFDQNNNRPAALAHYLAIHHIDIMDFIDSKVPTGNQKLKCLDLFPAVWSNWLFRYRVATDGDWTVFCPKYARQLRQLHGPDWAREYIRLEKTLKTKYRTTYKAREIKRRITSAQTKSGTPYVCNGDAANVKSNHSHLGTLRMSNLCAEIMEYSDEKTTASCNLHSVNMEVFAKEEVKLTPESVPEEIALAVDFKLLGQASRQAILCVNQAIDCGYSPLDEMDESGNIIRGRISRVNQFQRAIGLGVAGQAGLLAKLDLPFECSATVHLSKMFFACMYFNSIVESVQQSVVHGPCGAFAGSKMSQGKFQFDLWADELRILNENTDLYGDMFTRLRNPDDDKPISPTLWKQEPVELVKNGVVVDVIHPSWESLRDAVMTHGMRNSLLTALMPTASSSQLRNVCESFEAPQSNLYSRKVYKANYSVLNHFMVSDLKEIGAWSEDTPDFLLQYNGSIRGLTEHVCNNKDCYPNWDEKNVGRLKYLETKYKTMWEVSQKFMINLAALRGRYIDQSTSLNIYIRDSDPVKIEAAEAYSYDVGNKTIVYYVRSNGADNAKIMTKKAVRSVKKSRVEESVDFSEVEDNLEVCDRSDPNCIACNS